MDRKYDTPDGRPPVMLLPNEWKRAEAAGVDMRWYAKIGLIPTGPYPSLGSRLCGVSRGGFELKWVDG